MRVICLTCNKEFDKMPSQIRKCPNNYCSRKCSAKSTNRVPKRKLSNTCKSCEKPIRKNRIYCNCCVDTLYMKDITVKEAKSRYEKHHKTSAFALIRTRARAVAKELGWKSCSICQYSKHIEIAHIKAISDFDENTLISVVNHPDNLKPLCPNCHWEFDNLK